MKKLISLLLALVLCFGALVSCSDNDGDESLPEGMSGKVAASLVLANERLSAQQLKNSENIFDGGVETLTALARQANASVASYTLVSDSKISAVALSDTTYECLDGSSVVVDGDVYRWQGFVDYSNSYDYFLNLTKGISSSAKVGAELIDNAKKFVRVVDKWVELDSTEIYLHVEENAEILLERNDIFIKICKRYKNSEGNTVYEIFQHEGSNSTRMVYIAGKKCEYSSVSDFGFNHNFLAENTKGFWEVVDVGRIDAGWYNVSCMVAKDDICYDAYYSPADAENAAYVSSISVISADRSNDIMSVQLGEGEAFIELDLQAFGGYSYLEAICPPDKVSRPISGVSDGDIIRIDDVNTTGFQTNNSSRTELVLGNGRKIKKGDFFADNTVRVDMLNVRYFSKEPKEGSHVYINGYAPSISLYVVGDSYDGIMQNLNAFLSETGLVPKYDMNYVKEGVLRAREELSQFTKYHEWNESPIYSRSDLDRGWENNMAKHEGFLALYDEVKDAQVIDIRDTDVYEMNIRFAPISSSLAESVSNDGLVISVDGLALSVTDTLLFVEGEKYTVNFALLPISGSDTGLIHLDAEGAALTEYALGDGFSLAADATLTLPVLAEGDYTLVAYISTHDGIRSSGYARVAFTAVNGYVHDDGRKNAIITEDGQGGFIFRITTVDDVKIALPEGEAFTAQTLRDLLSDRIYEFAFVAEGASLEVADENGNFAPVSDGSAPLESGVFRLKYSLENGTSSKEGYVTAIYEAPTAE